MHKLKQLPWQLIVGLGALALVWPVMNVSGLMDRLGRPAGPIIIIVLISLAWLATVVLAGVRQPLLTLVCTGLTYGVFVIVSSAILSPLLTARLGGPITVPAAFVSVLVTNTLWGGLVGLCALALQKLAGSVR